jgi:hypothetical protein
VTFDLDGLVAGGEAAVVTARALDAGANVAATDLSLEASGAILSGVHVRRPGEVVARVAAGAILTVDEAVVTATSERAGISGARALRLRPADAARVRFRPREGVVRSDGTREAVLRVSVADRFGNPVRTAPAVSAARGRVVEVAERGRGEYAVRYVGPAVQRAEPDELVARVGTIRATAAPLLAPPGPVLLASARAGVAVDARGRFGGPAAGVVAELPGDVALAVRNGAELAWRLEAEGLRGRSGAGLAALLVGAGVRRPFGAAMELGGSASGGVVLAPGGASAGGRLALALGVRRGWGTPFVEASVLGARAGAPGAFAAVGLAAGVRFGWETSHGNDPHRR